jgi:carboxypeptidase C (cathepsin A)
MKTFFALIIILQMLAFVPGARAADKENAAEQQNQKTGSIEDASQTQHTININGRVLSYQATAGFISINDEANKPEAKIFFIAYTKNDEPNVSHRPITFAFNGGPGASSIWLHMGLMGPRRAMLADDGTALPKSYKLVDNEYTWLDFTDMVFIDPVGTGYSRAADEDKAQQFYNMDEDTKLLAEFVRLYVTDCGRWLSPKYITGESYGTTRAVKLTDYLQNKDSMLVDGLVLLSAALNFETFSFDGGNDLAYVLAVPSYTAAAWYHKKLPHDLQDNFAVTLEEARDWAINSYLPALAWGADLPDSERKKIVEKLSRYTGLSKSYIENSRMRIANYRFTTELLRDSSYIIGMLDSRVKAPSLSGVSEYPYQDPSLFITQGSYAAMFNNYVRDALNFKTSLQYIAISDKVNQSWKWSSGKQGYVDVTASLAEAMSLNDHLRVFVGSGYFDLTTPWLSQQYTLTHLGIADVLQGNITHRYYESGHQIYTSIPALKKLTSDAASFFQQQPAESAQ